MKNTEPWLEQLTRRFNLLNNLKPSSLDEPEVRGAKRYSSINPEFDISTSRATFLYKGTEGNYRGSCLTTFETVNLEMLFANNTVPVVYGYNPHNTREVAELFVAQYGLSLDVDWFESTPFDATILPTHVTLHTVSNDYCARSKLTVRVERSETDIGELFENDIIDAPKLPFDPVFRNCTIPTYGKDFTPFYSEQKEWFANMLVRDGYYYGFTTMVADPLNGRRELCEFLAEIIGNDAELNLTDSTGAAVLNKINMMYFYVRYHGTTKNAVYANVSADVTYDNVLILESHLAKDVTNYDGPLFIHYNNA